jgi:hypothetical protein
MNGERSEDDYKSIEFYSQLINAWFQYRMEFDKSIMTLSIAGIGVLITFMSTFGIKNVNCCILALYIMSILFFISTIILILIIFILNTNQINKYLQKNESSINLRWYDYFIRISFIVASVLTIILSFINGFTK